VVDLPKDILIGPAPYSPPSRQPHRSYRPVTEPDPAAIARAVDVLAIARRPIVYAGGGVINAGPEAATLLAEFVHLTGFPCTTTLMGLGAFPASDPAFLGMLGMHGTYEANLAMHGCDVMFNIGARFDDRVTGRLNAFSPDSLKIHADIDPSNINKNVAVDIAIVGDAAKVLRAMLAEWRRRAVDLNRVALTQWWRQIDQWRGKDSLRFTQKMAPGTIIKPQYAVQRLYEICRESGRDTFITTEVGQHQMWAAQYFKFEKRAGDRHRRRGQHPDEHPGNGNAGAIPSAGEDFHFEQRIHGHGAPVAGIAARRPLFGKLQRRPAGFRQTCGKFSCDRPARQNGG
jgi:acetolactate synthase-1/2/3 large subunit